MSTITKKILALVVGAGMFAPSLAFADTASSIQALLDQIKSLQAQIAALQLQQQTLVQQQQDVFASLTTQMQEGSTGDQVTALQQLLASDPQLYPEKIVSGYFGKLTAMAVKRFQKKYGIDQAGRVGPQTLKKFNEIFGHHMTSSTNNGGSNGNSNSNGNNGWGWNTGNNGNSSSTNDGDDDEQNDGKGPCKVPPGHLIAPGFLKNFIFGNKAFRGRDRSTLRPCQGIIPSGTSTDTTAPELSSITSAGITTTAAMIQWLTNENATSQVEYGTTASYGTATTVDTNKVLTHSVALSGLAANTTYHYRVISKDAAGNTATSSDQVFTTSMTLDTTAPVLSGISATGITTTGATINWATDEGATSQVAYGTDSALGATTTLDAALVTSHGVALTALTPNTTYTYRITSNDSSGNSAYSGLYTFTTNALDTTAPVISAINVFPIASTTATVNWTTNEAATSKVYYGTTDPVDTATASIASDGSLLTSHAIGLTGLSTTTTYYFLVVSSDAAANTATSSQASFLTTN